MIIRALFTRLCALANAYAAVYSFNHHYYIMMAMASVLAIGAAVESAICSALSEYRKVK